MLNQRVLAILAIMLACSLPVRAAEITLKNGVEITGNSGKISSMGKDPLKAQGSDAVGNQLIVFADDGLRRRYTSTYQVQAIAEAAPVVMERIKIKQNVDTSGQRVVGVGAIHHVTPFDTWGRRIVTMQTLRGPVKVIQGITEVTPEWTKVEGLVSRGTPSYVWDMRIATSSLPRATLSAVLEKNIDKEDADQRLKIVRLYLQAKRYRDAGQELAKVIKDFPELKQLKKEVQALRQVSAQRLIQEIELRKAAGQHPLTYNMLSSFPDEGVAGETLLKVRQMLGDYDKQIRTREKALKLFAGELAEVKDADHKLQLEKVQEELKVELNLTTLDRMADFLRLADDNNLSAEEKLALATSGWLLGSGEGTENIVVALSLYKVRNLVRTYMQTDSGVTRRAILAELTSEEGGTPNYVAQLLGHMKPPKVTQPETQTKTPGLFRLTVPGLAGQADFVYHIQLPPHYDPYRKYPTVVTLNAGGLSAETQIEWWAGNFHEKMKMRMGQASRHGYIVIAPTWMKEHQTGYEFSAREHAAVLYTLRDACRRFSVDTDRVFLSGHSAGGDAAWDIGLAHPDLWAGVIPIVPVARKYVSRYWENAEYVPLYFVMGQLDGDKMTKNARDLDRYLRKPRFDTMVVEYLGRGHEHFSDEIQNIFEWMNVHRRNGMPKEFRCTSMRPWDDFFWWVEVDSIPQHAIVHPTQWAQTANKVRPLIVEGNIYGNNNLRVLTGAGAVTVWLSPEMVDFEKRVGVRHGRTNRSFPIQPSTEVILEDVRTRGDRQHPFWAKLEF